MGRSEIIRATLAFTGLLAFGALALVACSSDSSGGDGGVPGTDGTTPGVDSVTPGADSIVPGTDGLPPPADQGGAGQPPYPAQSGVVYVSHFLTKELRIFRVDGAAPRAVGQIDLGKITHDLALDPFNDVLYLASDEAREVDVFKLSRPAGPGQPVTPPTPVATISFTDRMPLFVRIDPHHGRLYVLAAPPIAGVVTEYELFVYDVSNPSSPTPLAGTPHKVPVGAAVALDGWRERLFLIAIKDKRLYGYDVSGGNLQPLAGSSIELQELYPQENSFAFQARGLTVDPYRRRLYAARAQGVLSELIAFEYPDQLTAMDQLKKLDDPFDSDTPPAERKNLLDGFEPKVDFQRGHVLMSAAAHDGVIPAAVVVAIDVSLSKIGDGCKHVEEFGCWYEHYFKGEPGARKRTDGAACVDATNGVFVGTAIANGDEAEPGTMHFFKYQDDLTMTPFVASDGKSLAAGGLPIAAACH